MRAASSSVLAMFLATFGCHGEPVGEAASDASTDASSEANDSSDATIVWPDGSTVDNGSCGVHPGPRMVQIDVPSDGGTRSYCIDTTEVTNRDYNHFLASTAKPKIGTFCGALDYGVETTVALNEFPRSSIPWCAAFGYCAWAGKRLCGKIGGGHTEFADFKQPSVSQWSYVCRQGPANTGWPYGATYDVARCNGDTMSSSYVKSKADCHGQAKPYDEIFDMAGNAGEWEDACDVYDRPTDRRCHIRGGWAGNTDTSCDEPTDADVNFTAPDLGFRCCVDL